MKKLNNLVVAVFLAACIVPCDSLRADDWPQWHGVNRDAKSAETGLLQEWPQAGPTLAWTTVGVGAGYGAPSIANGFIFGLSNRGNDEVVWCLEEASGREVWVARIAEACELGIEQGKEGPGSSPTVDEDHLYVIGAGGTVACLEVSDGGVVWQREMIDEFKGRVPVWRYAESPLIDNGKVICTPGGIQSSVVALDQATGKTLWECHIPDFVDEADGEGNDQPLRDGFPAPSGAAYASTIAIDSEGQRQYVQYMATTLAGISDDGNLLWRYDGAANAARINCSSPIFLEGLVFAASAYGHGGGAVELTRDDDGTMHAEEIYFSTNMKNHHGGMIVVDGALYGAHGGNGGGFLSCLDFETGEILWRDRDAPKGSLANADGRLYLRSEDGEILLIEPSRDELRIKGRFEQPDRTEQPAWTHPVVANGILFIRDQDTLYAYSVSR